jgi:hypothetical protein
MQDQPQVASRDSLCYSLKVAFEAMELPVAVGPAPETEM